MRGRKMPYELDYTIFTDNETGDVWASPEKTLYLVKDIGICTFCKNFIVQYAKLSHPNKKEWLQVNCQICSPIDKYPYNRRVLRTC